MENFYHYTKERQPYQKWLRNISLNALDSILDFESKRRITGLQNLIDASMIVSIYPQYSLLLVPNHDTDIYLDVLTIPYIYYKYCFPITGRHLIYPAGHERTNFLTDPILTSAYSIGAAIFGYQKYRLIQTNSILENIRNGKYKASELLINHKNFFNLFNNPYCGCIFIQGKREQANLPISGKIGTAKISMKGHTIILPIGFKKNEEPGLAINKFSTNFTINIGKGFLIDLRNLVNLNDVHSKIIQSIYNLL